MGCLTSTPKENIKKANIAKKEPVPETEEDDTEASQTESRDNSQYEPPTVNCTNNHDTYYLIQILRAEDVPKMDMTSDSDPYVILKIIDRNKNQKGQEIRTLYRLDNHNPIWNCYRTFAADRINDILKFELWDKDFMVGDSDDFIGDGSLKISAIFINVDDHHITTKKSYGQMSADCNSYEIDDEEEFVQEVEIKLKKKSKCKTKIFFKLFEIKVTPNTVEKKTFFFIRHGESKWNSAQDGKNIIGMYKQVDHPLNEEGIKQALKFNSLWKQEKESENEHKYGRDLNDFLKSEVIYSSPLCRATQTAMLTLLDHPCMNARGIIFARNLREIKKVGGADTLANKCGKEQCKKIIDNILKYNELIEDVSVKDKISKYNIDCNDSNNGQKWWSVSVDTKKQFYERLNDLMYYLRYSHETNIICVGHSLWIRGFFKRYIQKEDVEGYTSKNVLGDILKKDVFDDEGLSEDNEKLMNDLKKQKIQNAGCVRVDVAFSDSFENGVKIQDVKLLFGSQLIN